MVLLVLQRFALRAMRTLCKNHMRQYNVVIICGVIQYARAKYPVIGSALAPAKLATEPHPTSKEIDTEDDHGNDGETTSRSGLDWV